MRLARLDGIRGLAIMMVFAHHTLKFKPGWMGVDLFFVLSGYLITTLLRRDRNDRSFWAPFYIKRATRILPPLLVCFLFAATLTDFPWHQQGLYFLFFAANIGQVLHPITGDQGLTILWSLAVEEHFYLLWPFAVRYLDRRHLIQLLVAVLCTEPLVRGLFTPHVGWWTMYILTPFRLDGLAAGSLLAILTEEPLWAERLKRISGSAALACFAAYAGSSLAPSFSYKADSLWFNMVGYTLLTAVVTFGLAFTVFHEHSRVARFLASPFLAFMGLISYGTYLYHITVVLEMQRFVIFIGYNHITTFWPLTALITVTLAWASYRWYETPIVRWGQKKAKQVNHKPALQLAGE